MRGQQDVVNTLREAFAKDPKIQAERIRISLLGPDTLALSGEVTTLAEKEEAAFLARQVAPQFDLDNSLTVAGNRLASDAELTQRAQEALLQAGLPSALSVQVRHGEATLRGSAESLEQVRRARLAVSRVAGIRAVVEDHVATGRQQTVETLGPERTVVRGQVVEAGPGASIVVDMDEATVVNRIEEKLGRDLQPPRADEIKVEVRNGVVTLLGFVKSIEERAQAELLARSVPGVTQVRNLLASQDGSAGCNEALAAEIRAALGRSEHLSPADLKVFVMEDTAYLQGDVDVPEQAMRAQEVARQIPGIARVHSFLRVTERHPRPSHGAGRSADALRKHLPE